MDLLRHLGLIDYETTPDAPAPEGPPSEPAPEPTPEPAPEPPPEGEPEPEGAWQGPTREEWEQAQGQLAQYAEFINMLQTPSYPEPEQDPQAYELPPYDPYDPEAATAHMDARDARLLGAMQQMMAPLTEQFQDDSATRWAENTFSRLGVPEEDHWRDGVLFASAGFQQFDQYGRPLVNPQQAAAQGYAFLQQFAEAERAAERERIKQEGIQQDTVLKNRIAAPNVPSGPAGDQGVPEGMDELQAARIWRERQAAIS